MSKGHRPAGGIKGRQVIEKPVRTGAGARAISQRFVSRIGSSQGNKVTEREGTLNIDRPGPYAGPGYRPAPFGNEIATNVGKGSPGAGRTLYGQSGSQGTYGSVNPGNPRPRGELFPGWPSKK
jgi:hypothetical protein